MLYDNHRSNPAIIPVAGLTPQDLADFCKAAQLSFHAVGTPDNWDDAETFRAATLDVPARGVSIPFSKVLAWKAALAAIGPQITEGGVYLHFKGGIYTTVCEATEESTLRQVVVYRGVDGKVWTRPRENFFSVTTDSGGNLVPRFAYRAQLG